IEVLGGGSRGEQHGETGQRHCGQYSLRDRHCVSPGVAALRLAASLWRARLVSLVRNALARGSRLNEVWSQRFHFVTRASASVRCLPMSSRSASPEVTTIFSFLTSLMLRFNGRTRCLSARVNVQSSSSVSSA